MVDIRCSRRRDGPRATKTGVLAYRRVPWQTSPPDEQTARAYLLVGQGALSSGVGGLLGRGEQERRAERYILLERPASLGQNPDRRFHRRRTSSPHRQAITARQKDRDGTDKRTLTFKLAEANVHGWKFGLPPQRAAGQLSELTQKPLCQPPTGRAAGRAYFGKAYQPRPPRCCAASAKAHRASICPKVRTKGQLLRLRAAVDTIVASEVQLTGVQHAVGGRGGEGGKLTCVVVGQRSRKRRSCKPERKPASPRNRPWCQTAGETGNCGTSITQSCSASSSFV